MLSQEMNSQSLLPLATDAAGRTSSYYSLKGAVKAWIEVHITQGNAATILLSPLQATTVAGAGSKAISAARIRTKLTATTVDYTQQTEAATYTTDAGVATKIIEFELDLAKVLDIAGGFDCIGISTGASNVANLTSAVLRWEPRHAGATSESVITD